MVCIALFSDLRIHTGTLPPPPKKQQQKYCWFPSRDPGAPGLPVAILAPGSPLVSCLCLVAGDSWANRGPLSFLLGAIVGASSQVPATRTPPTVGKLPG